MNITILSGADHLRFPTMINHKAYADRHGYRYRFDVTPYASRANPYFHKLDSIDAALGDADWLFWIDDDAAFTQLDRSLQTLVPELADGSLHAIFCVSPVNPQGGWTTLSSGNFFVRNTAEGRDLIRQSRATDLDAVKAWWNAETLGMFTSGDQDAIVFQLTTNPLFSRGTALLEYERFNTRPYHFASPGQFFLVHFTHSPTSSKAEQMAGFCLKHGLTRFLLGEEDLRPYAGYVDPQLRMIGR